MSERVGSDIDFKKNNIAWVWTTLELLKDILYVGRLGVNWIEESGHEPVVQHKVYVKYHKHHCIWNRCGYR